MNLICIWMVKLKWHVCRWVVKFKTDYKHLKGATQGDRSRTDTTNNDVVKINLMLAKSNKIYPKATDLDNFISNTSLVWEFSSLLIISHSFRDIAITGKRLAIFEFRASEQWGLFSVPRLLWHETSVYDGHLRRSVTLTPIAERLAVEMSHPVLTT